MLSPIARWVSRSDKDPPVAPAPSRACPWQIIDFGSDALGVLSRSRARRYEVGMGTDRGTPSSTCRPASPPFDHTSHRNSRFPVVLVRSNQCMHLVVRPMPGLNMLQGSSCL